MDDYGNKLDDWAFLLMFLYAEQAQTERAWILGEYDEMDC